ncbi:MULTISPECIES: hypothetical protein [Pseudonocardia]|uniref:Uncharacterized protein n=2 Tax=Pseudonocardia TaxID=1847 RepID=A0A1Y2MY48_PSEAH|nr:MULTISPECIES: hypothetical protein [Pseudonocardia]OSY40136.1 hypothetical protein BG845_02959 [Pseudonocardia autotrophica]TDN72918.1 hypothetical protein C8E95_1989 [Pseudonocardia autotrophica]
MPYEVRSAVWRAALRPAGGAPGIHDPAEPVLPGRARVRRPTAEPLPARSAR